MSMSQGAHYAGDGETDVLLRQHRLRSHQRFLHQSRRGIPRARAHQSRRHRSARRGSGAHRSGRGRHVPEYQHAVRAGLSVSQPDLWRRRLRDQTALAECGRADRRQRRDLRHVAPAATNTRPRSRTTACRTASRTPIRTPARSPTSVPSASARAKKPRRPTSAPRSASRARSGAWNWDFACTYGKDEIDMFTRDSANASLYANTGADAGGFLRRHLHADAVDHEPRCDPRDRRRHGRSHEPGVRRSSIARRPGKRRPATKARATSKAASRSRASACRMPASTSAT